MPGKTPQGWPCRPRPAGDGAGSGTPVDLGVLFHAYPGVGGELPTAIDRAVRDLTVELARQRAQLPPGLAYRPDLTTFDLTHDGGRVVLTVVEYFEPPRPLSRGDDDPDGAVRPLSSR